MGATINRLKCSIAERGCCDRFRSWRRNIEMMQCILYQPIGNAPDPALDAREVVALGDIDN